MSDGLEISKKSAANPKYSASNPHPEYANLMRSKTFMKNSKKYQENYDKIDWSKKLDDKEPDQLEMFEKPDKPKNKHKYEILEICHQLLRLGVPKECVDPVMDYANKLVTKRGE